MPLCGVHTGVLFSGWTLDVSVRFRGCVRDILPLVSQQDWEPGYTHATRTGKCHRKAGLHYSLWGRHAVLSDASWKLVVRWLVQASLTCSKSPPLLFIIRWDAIEYEMKFSDSYDSIAAAFNHIEMMFTQTASRYRTLERLFIQSFIDTMYQVW
jgi:hypothetical protein